ncbi:hypothetical protein GGP91_002827 [Salinibacter ruber]|jgi:hypothetical protein|uniref:hypothetical protein n=1 Tax=Salinibacter ruber TaxID=146919 RepID=UPI0020740389|nr:hypothetical protein [Salinibacter ruber]MCS3830734.1 hypothetical protein [Salinibacter ruber]MCS4057921.1 hypothetical protein [Salinibacter ruber]MCS4162868.1 hypothetical protein [Salinibacter ruber]
MPTGTATPDTTTLEVEDGILHWTNEDFFISVEEAKQVKRHVENAFGRVDGILVDNTGAGGTWPTEIDEVWGKLMQNIYGEGVPCATVAASAANAMHVNRLSRKNETDDLIRAFKPGEKAEALDFVSS